MKLCLHNINCIINHLCFAAIKQTLRLKDKNIISKFKNCPNISGITRKINLVTTKLTRDSMIIIMAYTSYRHDRYDWLHSFIIKLKITAAHMICKPVYNAVIKTPKGWCNTNMSSYHCRGSRCRYGSILRPSNLHNGITILVRRYFLHRVRSQNSWLA